MNLLFYYLACSSMNRYLLKGLGDQSDEVRFKKGLVVYIEIKKAGAHVRITYLSLSSTVSLLPDFRCLHNSRYFCGIQLFIYTFAKYCISDV